MDRGENAFLRLRVSKMSQHGIETEQGRKCDGSVINKADDTECDVHVIYKTDNAESDVKSEVPDGGWGWMIVLSACLAHFIVGGYEKSSGILFLQLQEKFGESAAMTSLVSSVSTTCRLFGGVIASALISKFSCRKVALCGATIHSLGILLSAFTPNMNFLLFSFGFLGGFGSSMVFTISIVLIGQYFKERQGLAVGIASAGVGLGTFVFPPLMEALYKKYAFLGEFLVLSGLSANEFVCACLFRPLPDRTPKRSSASKEEQELQVQLLDSKLPSMDTGHEENVSTEDDLGDRKDHKSSIQRKMQHMKQLFKNKKDSNRKFTLEISLLKNYTFLSVCLAILFFTSSYASAFLYLPALSKSRGMSDMEAAYLLSIAGIADIISRITSGFLFDHHKIKPHRLLVYNGNMFVFGLLIFVYPQMSTFWGFATMVGIFGLLTGCCVSQMSVVLVDVLGSQKLPSAFGILMWFMGMSLWIGPPIGGALKDRYGIYDASFYFGGSGIIFGALTMLSGNGWKIYNDRQTDKI